MQRQFKIILWLVICGFLTRFTQGADLEAENILAQSEQSLEKLAGFRVNYRAFQEHIAGVPELGMIGSFTVQAGNRFYLTNTGAFFIYDSRMECASDGTNYLSVMPGMPRAIQWEPKYIHANFDKSLIKLFVFGGATPLIASQLKAGLDEPGANATARLLPFMTNQFSANDAHLLDDEILEGTRSKHIEFTWSDGTNEPVKMDLWMDKSTFLPVKRIMHDTRAGDVIETYTFESNPSLAPETCDPRRIIRSTKLEAVIHQMETPDALLLKACREGNLKLAEESVAKGANVNAKTSIMDRPPSFSPLLFAARGGNLDLVKFLVEHGAEINAGALGGAPPLQFACMNGKIEAVDYLIQHGATLTNATASLCWAAWGGHSNIVALLVEKGVPVDESAGELGTPLQRALQGGFLNIAAFLIDHGADISKTERGSPLLGTAVRFGNPETVKFLLEAGAKPNERDSYGMTPLMYAASGNYAEAAKLLLEHGADPQLKDPRGQTAMGMVSRHLPNKEIVAFFEQKGLIRPVQSNVQKP